MMTHPHTVRSFDREMEALRAQVAEMGTLTQRALEVSLEVLAHHDTVAARDLIDRDQAINDHHHGIETTAVRIMALRHPLADDLREVVAALRIATDLERIGDHAKSIAKHSISLTEAGRIDCGTQIQEMGHAVSAMVSQALQAFLSANAELARSVRVTDVEIDTRHTDVFRDLLVLAHENSDHIDAAAHQMFIARGLERIGDHATNIAEQALFSVQGELPRDDRPQADNAAFVVMEEN